MKYSVVAAALAFAVLFASSSIAPVQAQPYWYPGSGPTQGGM